ncbi:MAG: peroxiredoxin family protein [Amphiplicatus sp.]
MAIMKWLAAAGAVLGMSFGTAGAADLGPPVGARMPHDLAAEDATGAARSFDNLAGENGMALFFVRSVDWCPYCQRQTLEVNAAKPEFDARGLSVVVVSYDPVEKQKAFADKNDVSATLLSDPRSEIIDAFGLRNEKHATGRAAGIPHPAVFIVGPDRVIRAKLYEEDFATDDKSYTKRPAVEAVLSAADKAMSAPMSDH